MVSPHVPSTPVHKNDPENAHIDETTRVNGIKTIVATRMGKTALCNARRKEYEPMVLKTVIKVRNGTACSNVEYGTALGQSGGL